MKKLTLLICLIYLTGCNDGSGQKDWIFPSPTPFSPFIQLSTAELAFTGVGCGSNPASQTFEITNAGKGTFTWSTSNVPSWLMLTPSGRDGSHNGDGADRHDRSFLRRGLFANGSY
ncbi:MAG: hypothetical protein MPW15_05205 [Candidatus Manganitrophus sp.]|nr:hypothetical protein [Candidatus Manganitrophus sp.]